MTSSTWKVQPIYTTIMEILKEKGSLTDEEIFERLKAFYKDIGISELNNALMKMEVTGLISVSTLTKDKRMVQLVKAK